MRDHIRSVRLSIDEGSRLEPTIARVHFVANGPIEEEARAKLDAWWQTAYLEAEANGINLLPNEYHEYVHRPRCLRTDDHAERLKGL
jgi:hypothetical protein